MNRPIETDVNQIKGENLNRIIKKGETYGKHLWVHLGHDGRNG